MRFCSCTHSSPENINPVEIQVFFFNYTHERIKNTPKPPVKANFLLTLSMTCNNN